MRDNQSTTDDSKAATADKSQPAAPTISLPKGGGAIRGIGEKFAANPVTGTGSMSVPIAVSPGRAGFGPQLSLSYDSGAGNGPFGFGWNLSLPSITRKTDKGLPQYHDAEESDVFILSGAEDLVPEFKKDEDGTWIIIDGKHVIFDEPRPVDGVTYRVRRYRPRIEGLFARIERWTNEVTGDIDWRSITRDNITTLYGKSNNSRIFDPDDFDPEHPTRIFSWLICESYDDKGNVIVYGYQAEDDRNIDQGQANERNRVRTASRYLKYIHYGNHTPYFPVLDANAPWPTPPGPGNWFFEVVFDYGEHDPANPQPDDAVAWPGRNDPFSTYRAGFEVRTYRLCQRVLIFHHFEGEPGVGKDCLVRSTDFTYSYEQSPSDARNLIYSFLLAITQSGYKRDNSGYLKRSLPPVEFEYTLPTVQDRVEEVNPTSLENLPIGVDGSAYQWTDLHGEGIPGVLTEQAGAWFYKRNLSPITVKQDNGATHTEAKFAAVELVAAKPNLALAGGQAQFMDLAGDGQPDLVVLDGPMPGLYEHDGAEGWQPFHLFTARLNRDMRDPNLKFVDLDGDGHADVLICEDDAFVWHPSLAEEGFGPARRVHQVLDEEKGPRLVFADGTQSIYLADLSGDGLTDLARVCNGEVCYWPNLGYGRFGAKVTMDYAPLFDNPDMFDPKRIRLADIDGSGTTDIIYLHRDGVRLYFNQSGNSWSAPQLLRVFPRVDDLVSIVPTDLLGNGTACLVWSSPLPGDARRPMRYVNLMGGQKPHLLVKTVNNLGAETTVEYAPSTKFYLEDKAAGKPWITKLPFPVHVVERVTVTDTWRKTSFSSTYSYHHGYFDGPEREFRGFGRVEQVDVESYGEFEQGNAASPYITDDKTLYQPPIKTITWYHTGAFLDRERILSHFEHEYFPRWLEDRHPGLNIAFQENQLPQPDLEAENLNAEEWREALRACKGMMLRQEVVELDIDALERPKDPEQLPVKLFSTAYHNCHIRRLQPKDVNRHAVFLVAESEAITYHYELDIREEQLLQLDPDPRIAHTLNLQYDEYANVLQSVAVVYPRLGTFEDDANLAAGLNDALSLIRQVQKEETHLAYSETRYTDDFGTKLEDKVAALDNHRLRLPCEVLTYELTGIKPTSGLHFTLDELRAFQLSPVHQSSGEVVQEISYHQLPDRTIPPKKEKRLVEHARTLFFTENLVDPLPFGEHGRLGLTYEAYKLALTEALLDAVFKDAAGNNKLDQPIDGASTARAKLNDPARSGYLSGAQLVKRFASIPATELTGQYWIRSGIAGFASDAAQHFYLPERYTDPFDNVTTLEYDPRDLFVASSTDPMGNVTRVTKPDSGKYNFDYRVLAPREMQDINDNLSEVYFDVLGLPTAMAVKGKGNEGDNLTGFTDALANPNSAELAVFFNPPVTVPTFDETQARHWLDNATARHIYYFGEVIENDKPVWGQHPACACGILRERHVAQLEPGENSLLQAGFEYSDGMGSVLVKKVQAEPEEAGQPMRWVASGKTILNNKGKPVKQYEPYFSPPAVGHRFEEPAEVGVTPVIYYDAAGRVIRTESPDGSYSRVEFSPWHVQTFDQNDTVKASTWYTDRNPLDPDQPLPHHPITGELLATPDQRAAWLAAQHANTPTVTFLDSLGRDVVSVAHNRSGPPDALVDEKHVTFTKLDAEGKPLWVQDARRNRVMQYVTPALPEGVHPFDDPNNLNPQGFAPCYDIAGNLLFQHSMDAGERWLLNDAAGKPMFAWNSRGFITHAEYDELHRPTALIVTDKDGHSFGAERTAYGETAFGEVKTDAVARELAQQTNHLGKLYQVYDGAGIVTNVTYDFKGNLMQGERRLLRDYAVQVNWPALQSPPQALSALLESEIFVSRTRYDALNRPIQIIAPHSTAANPPRINVAQPGYNEAGLLERMDVWLNRTTEPTALLDPATANQPGVTNINYNAKGQRVLIAYDNGVTTSYDYEPETFRLKRLRTTRSSDGAALQDLNYTYDPVGNIMQIRDNAQDSVFHNNQVVLPGGEYRYDALYRLIAAGGREHKGNQQQVDWDDSARVVNTLPNDGQALQNYVEQYTYDGVGNIMQMIHHAGRDLEQPGQVIWNRRYQYALDSNRLLATSLPGEGNLPSYVAVPGYSAQYTYDLHGNMTTIPHLPLMQWDDRDQLQATTQQVVNNGGTPEMTWYVYDAAGQRVRKVTERQAAAGQTPTRMKERIYLGGFEIYREYQNDGDTVTLERETLHIMDDQQRIALVETRTDTPVSAQLIRYQFGNHLGSASLELDDIGQIISYAEYYPYGSTSYQAVRNGIEISPKRYRYTGMERDEESGLNYHTARYYAPWLARWVSADPIGIEGGLNLFLYTENNPLFFNDKKGTDSTDAHGGRAIEQALKLRDMYTKWGFSYEVINENTSRWTSPSGSTVVDITLNASSPRIISTTKVGASYEISEFDFSKGKFSKRERYIEQELIGTRKLGFFEIWGSGIVLLYKGTVETFFGGSHANAPTSSDSKLYDRQSYWDQAKALALGVGVGKLAGKVFGPIWRKLTGRATPSSTPPAPNTKPPKAKKGSDPKSTTDARGAKGGGDQVYGPYGPVSRVELEAAAASTGPSIRVVTSLKQAPQAGRAVSTAVGEGAETLAKAAQPTGEIFSAQIPSKLLSLLESAGLAVRSTTSMGGVTATEIRFLAGAAEFIAPLFRRGAL